MTTLRPASVANTRVEKREVQHYDGHAKKAGVDAFKKGLRARRSRRDTRRWIRDEVLR